MVVPELGKTELFAGLARAPAAVRHLSLNKTPINVLVAFGTSLATGEIRGAPNLGTRAKTKHESWESQRAEYISLIVPHPVPSPPIGESKI